MNDFRADGADAWTAVGGERSAVEWDITRGKHGNRNSTKGSLGNSTSSPTSSIHTAVRESLLIPVSTLGRDVRGLMCRVEVTHVVTVVVADHKISEEHGGEIGMFYVTLHGSRGSSSRTRLGDEYVHHFGFQL